MFPPKLKEYWCHPCHAEIIHKMRLSIRGHIEKHMCYKSQHQGMGFCRQRRYVTEFGSYKWQMLKSLVKTNSLTSNRHSPHVHDCIGFKSFVIQRNMARHLVRGRVRVEYIRFEYPSDLLTLIDLFGECVIKGPRCGRPTQRSPSLELTEGCACNYIHSEFSFTDEDEYYSSPKKFIKATTKCGVDFKHDGSNRLTIFTRYNGVSIKCDCLCKFYHSVLLTLSLSLLRLMLLDQLIILY